MSQGGSHAFVVFKSYPDDSNAARFENHYSRQSDVTRICLKKKKKNSRRRKEKRRKRKWKGKRGRGRRKGRKRKE